MERVSIKVFISSNDPMTTQGQESPQQKKAHREAIYENYNVAILTVRPKY